MKVLVCCEESQRVTTAFRELRHEAYSCDILDPSGGHREWHIKGDCLPLINGDCEFETMDGTKHKVEGKWDLLFAFPPCTFLTVTGNRWFNEEKFGEEARERKRNREEAAEFFMEFVNADCNHICVENPGGCMNTRYRKPDQIIQPYMFGDPFEKQTCLWLIGLPKLEYTNVVEPPPRQQLKSGKSMPEWYSNAPKRERARLRAVTFSGIAEAFATQYSKYLQGN